MRTIIQICRVIVGSLFIVSGLIKANDALGFSYKLQEYFEPEVLNWAWLEPYAFQVAALVCLGEVVLGMALILGGRMKLTSWLMMGMLVFFAFLTFYSAYFEKVTDCGCFGDAIKLTPWESFTKDIVLLVLFVPVFLQRGKIQLNDRKVDLLLMSMSLVLIALFSIGMLHWNFPIYFSLVGFALALLIKHFVQGAKAEWTVAGMLILISVLFVHHTYAHLPIKDFRPYAIGRSIPDQMTIPEGMEGDVYETILTYKNTATGEVKDFSANNYPWDDATWEWVNTENKLVKKGYTPPIHDLILTDVDGVDVTDGVLSEPTPVFLLIAYDISATKTSCQPAINAIAEAAFKDGYYFYGVSSSGYENVEEFRHANQNAFDYLACDETTLKTIIRSNPGLMLLREGRVVGKWHCNDMPDYASLATLLK